ncbi:precorrin-8X methylmutase [Beggiatoa alba]|nr:precorrin-8X methylmutase [Beggiatoa alba]
MPDYIKDPNGIEEESFKRIKALTDLTGFDEQQQQIVMRLVHTCANPDITKQVRISDNAVQAGIEALENRVSIFCDVEMVKQGLTKRYLNVKPQCFLNHLSVATKAEENNETRTMTAVEYWGNELQDSIAIIGNAPTALFRLLENIQQGKAKPALIIGIPVGFVGAAESKDYLWNSYKDIGVECITLLGRTGGSALAAAAFNTLIRLQRGLRF